MRFRTPCSDANALRLSRRLLLRVSVLGAQMMLSAMLRSIDRSCGALSLATVLAPPLKLTSRINQADSLRRSATAPPWPVARVERARVNVVASLKIRPLVADGLHRVDLLDRQALWAVGWGDHALRRQRR